MCLDEAQAEVVFAITQEALRVALYFPVSALRTSPSSPGPSTKVTVSPQLNSTNIILHP